MPKIGRILISTVLFITYFSVTALADRVVTDASGRTVTVPDTVTRVICSGSGSLRLLCYLQAQDLVVAVDDAETKQRFLDARPYSLANPQFKKMKTFGEFRGHDNPELILTLEPQPQVILKTYSGMGHDPVELQNKTGIPVVVLEYGDLGKSKAKFYDALRIMGEVVGKSDRAEEVVAFFEAEIAELQKRTADIPQADRPTAFIGGVAHKGPHGFQSTEPAYPPFAFAGVRNLALESGVAGGQLSQSNVAKEKIVEWDPDFLFLDLSTLQMGENAGGLHELKTDPAYRSLSAVKEGRVFGVLPYNWYTTNYGSILADAWFIAKTIHSDRFADVDPVAKADDIYVFLVGKPVFSGMNALFDGLVFTNLAVN
ncbi:MAG: iron ABC transporter substrate-binding protein [Deltaproteobacteria bacterium]|nr:iron ABC transporter substrate-binding protein [Deltaproteobacteria bacterium]